ncbi:hypothetical protein L6164_007091 [Bauhinia variegata]|uniref:Uncharacterized protein n=1 Tax=Bauhinia variegata TaxID=167791 RepID=A0ACB9PWG6_BAUVA|nr:hypothetical protein L6164_007091 [Bauhinia variegata]
MLNKVKIITFLSITKSNFFYTLLLSCLVSALSFLLPRFCSFSKYPFITISSSFPPLSSDCVKRFSGDT